MKFIRTFLLVIYLAWTSFWFFALISILILFVVLFSIIRKKNPYIFYSAKLMCKSWFLISFISVEEHYEDREKSKKILHSSNVIFIANHISYLDIPTLYASQIKFFYFLSKVEILSSPLLGFLCSQLAFTVKREDFRSRQKSLEQLANILVKEEKNIFIFPEGTFNESKNELLLPLQMGAFGLAIKTKRPIYPLILLDTHRRMNYKKTLMFVPGRNRVYHLPPITSHLEKNISSLELMNEVKQKMHAKLDKLNFKIE